MIDLAFDIPRDDLSALVHAGPAFVTFGEVMVRDTPADGERLERTRLVHLSMAGSEYNVAIGLSRFGISSAFITRVPDNPYGWAVRDNARSSGVATEHFVWASPYEPVGRYLYELGRTPRRMSNWYQRMYSAASRLGPGMVDWRTALRACQLFHLTGITLGISAHSGYARNYCREALDEALAAKPADCLVSMDYNYRSILWPKEQAYDVLTPVLHDQVDVLVTGIEDLCELYGMGVGPYGPDDILHGQYEYFADADLQTFMREACQRFKLKIVGLTIRYKASSEQHLWESVAMDAEGHYFRSPATQQVVMLDRLGGGDTWDVGFFYGLLTEATPLRRLQKGVLVGDAASCLQQTLMYDLPIVTKEETQALIRSAIAKRRT